MDDERLDDERLGDAQARRERRARVADVAARQQGVVTRHDLTELGVSSAALTAEVAAGRYRRLGAVTYLVHAADAPQAETFARFSAVLEVCPAATLDGLSSLHEAGLRSIEGDGLVHVSVPKSSRPRPVAGVRIHETRRWRPDDVACARGPQRTWPKVATVRAALWARTDREAALLLIAPLQQRLVRPEEVAEQLALIRRHRRRRLLLGVLADAVGGVQSMGELDFARLCRARGLPEPSRQVRRRRGDGVMFLDVRWDEWAVAAEIDGVHHLDVGPWMDDALRQNVATMADSRVLLRIPTIGLRVMPDRFMAQVEQALRAAGCPLRPNRSQQ